MKRNDEPYGDVESPVSPRCLSRVFSAIYLGVSTASVSQFAKAGFIPTVRYPTEHGLSRRPLFDIRDLDKFIDSSKVYRGT